MDDSPRLPATLIVLLLIIAATCGGGAFHCYFLYQEQLQIATESRRERDEAVAQEKEHRQTVEFLRERLGYQGPISDESLREAVSQDLQEFGNVAVGDNYRSVIDYLVRTIDEERRRGASLGKLNNDLQGQVATMQPAYERRVEISEKFQKDTATELLKEQDRSRENLLLLDNQMTALLDKLESTSEKLRESYTQRETDKDQATRKIQTLLAAIRNFRAKEAKQTDPAKDPPDGKVVYVDQSSRTVHLNVGREQGVRVGMTFRVYRPDSFGRAEKGVAKIEVLRLEPKRSVATIRQGDLLTPVIPGDLIFNPILRESRIESFALAGQLDIDGDGKDDTAQVRRLIERQGGRVVLHIDPKGKVEGKLVTGTKFVIMDEDRAGADAEYRRLLTDLHREAIEHGIPVISSRRFADEVGYRNDWSASR